jgi:hypothetical protein
MMIYLSVSAVYAGQLLIVLVDFLNMCDCVRTATKTGLFAQKRVFYEFPTFQQLQILVWP